jgi:hypothetical protein
VPRHPPSTLSRTRSRSFPGADTPRHDDGLTVVARASGIRLVVPVALPGLLPVRMIRAVRSARIRRSVLRPAGTLMRAEPPAGGGAAREGRAEQHQTADDDGDDRADVQAPGRRRIGMLCARVAGRRLPGWSGGGGGLGRGRRGSRLTGRLRCRRRLVFAHADSGSRTPMRGHRGGYGSAGDPRSAPLGVSGATRTNGRSRGMPRAASTAPRASRRPRSHASHTPQRFTHVARRL